MTYSFKSQAGAESGQDLPLEEVLAQAIIPSALGYEPQSSPLQLRLS